MNIFAIEKNINGTIDWKKSGASHDDYRCNKMLIESCQLLSTTASIFGHPTRYKNTHINHPCSLWVRESHENFSNLLQLALNLRKEFCTRFNKATHGCDDVLNQLVNLNNSGKNWIDSFPNILETSLPLCMPEEYKMDNSVDSYRNYFSNKPRLRYYHTQPPYWVKHFRSKNLPPVKVIKI